MLRQDGKNKLKFNKVKTFVKKLTDHRCEEKHQASCVHIKIMCAFNAPNYYIKLFAKRPCEGFGSLRTEEFADRFMGTIKAPSEFRHIYIRHLALLVC